MKNQLPLLLNHDHDAYTGHFMHQKTPQIESENKKLTPEEQWHIINDKLIPQGAD